MMKNTRKLRWLTAALVSTLGITAFAQDATNTARDSSGKSSEAAARNTAAQTQGRDMRASKLINKDVKNAQGASMGKIEDLIIDPQAQRVHYAVLSFGGVLGMGDKLFAFPASAFKVSRGTDELILNIAKERLEKAPGFDKDKWPNLSNDRYRGEVDRYHGSRSSGGNTPRAGSSENSAKQDADSGATMTRASELIGKKVHDREGKQAAEVEDIVVNMSNGQVRYVVLDLESGWSKDDKLVALPLKALSLPRKKGQDAVLNVPRDRIDTARGFKEDQWPDLNDPQYRRDQDNYLSIFDLGQGTSIERVEGPRRTPGRAASDRPGNANSGADRSGGSGASGIANGSQSSR